MSATVSRGDIWTEDETIALINAWGDQTVQLKLQGCHRNSDVYQSITEEVKKQGFCAERNWKQCRSKCKHLKAQYKKHKDCLAKSGNSRKKAPQFYDMLDNFLVDRPEAVGLENAIDSHSNNRVDSDSTGADIVNNLIDKYKKGEMIKKKCLRCGYEKDVYSAGVHETEGGCLKVYCEDDEFHCPKCELDDTIFGDSSDQDNVNHDSHVKEMVQPKQKPNESERPKKKKKTSVEKAVESFAASQKEADERFYNYLQKQSERSAKMHQEEMKAIRESTTSVATVVATAVVEALRHGVQQPRHPLFNPGPLNSISNQVIYHTSESSTSNYDNDPANLTYYQL